MMMSLFILYDFYMYKLLLLLLYLSFKKKNLIKDGSCELVFFYFRMADTCIHKIKIKLCLSLFSNFASCGSIKDYPMLSYQTQSEMYCFTCFFQQETLGIL